MPKIDISEVYTIAAAGATKSFNLDNDATQYYRLTTTGGVAVVLAANMIFQGTGTARTGMTLVFLYEGQVTLGANTLSFFGTALTADQCLYKQIITCYYTGTAWQVYIMSEDNENVKDFIITIIISILWSWLYWLSH